MNKLTVSTKKFLADPIQKKIVGNASCAVQSCGSCATEAGAVTLIAKTIAQIVKVNACETSQLCATVWAGRRTEVARLSDKIVPSRAFGYAESSWWVIDKDEVGRGTRGTDCCWVGTRQAVACATSTLSVRRGCVHVVRRTRHIASVVEIIAAIVACIAIVRESTIAGQTVWVAGKALLLACYFEVSLETWALVCVV